MSFRFEPMIGENQQYNDLRPTSFWSINSVNKSLSFISSIYCCFLLKQDFIGSSDPKNVKQLIKKQAEWCETTNDPKAAV